MRNILFVLITILNVLLSFGQSAKKPKIMVVPSDGLLNRMGLLKEGSDMGEEVSVQDYRKAFLDIELKAIISKFGEMMKERGFETVMLENELKRVQGKGLEVNYDIKVDLEYRIDKEGPRKKLTAIFSASDASGKQIAAASGVSAPAIGVSEVELLQEAVLDKIDQFNNQLMDTFNQMLEKGRESRLIITSQAIALDEDVFSGKSLVDIIEDWLTENCVNASFSTDNVASEVIEISQAMMPLFNEKGRAIDARNFYKNLEKKINLIVQTQKLKCSITKSKLAEVEIIIK